MGLAFLEYICYNIQQEGASTMIELIGGAILAGLVLFGVIGGFAGIVVWLIHRQPSRKNKDAVDT